jgi:hypothetical protein
MTKDRFILLAFALLCVGAQFALPAGRKGDSKGAEKFSDHDRHALEVGRKVIRIRSALEHPEKKESIDAVKSLGLDTRYYVMVRGWIVQHVSMTNSYKGTTAYKESKQRKAEIDNRIAALQRMLRAIDLE